MKNISLIMLLASTLLFTACQGTPAASTTQSSETVMTQTKYIDYSQKEYDLLLGKKTFAIFFHAPWCPICTSMEKDILANIDSLPENAVILKADFDTEKALEEKFGVTSQSIIVMIDDKGTKVKTLVAPSFDEIKNSFDNILK